MVAMFAVLLGSKKFAFVVTTMCLPSGAQSCLTARSRFIGSSSWKPLPVRSEPNSPSAGSVGPMRLKSVPEKVSIPLGETDDRAPGRERRLPLTAAHPAGEADAVAGVGVDHVDGRAQRLGVPVVLVDDRPAVRRPVRIDRLARAVRDLPQVVAVRAHREQLSALIRRDGVEGDQAVLGMGAAEAQPAAARAAIN